MKVQSIEMAEKQTADNKPRSKGSGTAYVYEKLKAEILTLEIAPGSPLEETLLAQRFGMSRSPVREALVRLSADGLVNMLSNRSTLVAPIDLAQFPRYVEALDLYQRVCTRLAAMNRSENDLLAIEKHARAFENACKTNDYLNMSASNRDFHVAIATAGGNPYFKQGYARMLDEGRRLLHMHFDYLSSSPEEALLTSEHADMIEAIRIKDTEKADQLAHAHTRQFHDRFMRFIQAKYLDGFDYSKSLLT